MVGNLLTEDEFNRVTGELARTIERLALAAPDVKAVLDAHNSAEWAAAIGMAEPDVSTAMTMVNKLNELIDIYRGAATKPVAEDFRQWTRPVRGLSSVI